jgi:hypothetical protein
MSILDVTNGGRNFRAVMAANSTYYNATTIRTAG